MVKSKFKNQEEKPVVTITPSQMSDPTDSNCPPNPSSNDGDDPAGMVI